MLPKEHKPSISRLEPKPPTQTLRKRSPVSYLQYREPLAWPPAHHPNILIDTNHPRARCGIGWHERASILQSSWDTWPNLEASLGLPIHTNVIHTSHVCTFSHLHFIPLRIFCYIPITDSYARGGSRGLAPAFRHSMLYFLFSDP